MPLSKSLKATLAKLTLAELDEIEAEVARRRAELKKGDIEVFRRKVALEARDLGIDIAEVFYPRDTVGARYRNPRTGDVWSGRGSAPRWMRLHMETSGETLEQAKERFRLK